MHVLDTPFEPSNQKRKRFSSVTCLLPTKTKRKHHIGGNQSDFSHGYGFQVLLAKGIQKKSKEKKK